MVIDAVDHGDPRMTSQLKLTVKLIDVNDHSPRFVDDRDKEVTTFNVTINETAINETVLKVTAIDQDSDENGLVSYKLNQTGDEIYFEIDQQTGILSVRELPTRRKQNVFYIHVIALDSGLPSKSSSALIIVTVLDVNKYYPVIVTSSVDGALNVFENITVGSVVLLLNVTDRDSKSAGMVSVSIINNSASWVALSTDESSLVVAESLDYEVLKIYCMYVVFDSMSLLIVFNLFRMVHTTLVCRCWHVIMVVLCDAAIRIIFICIFMMLTTMLPGSGKRLMLDLTLQLGSIMSQFWRV